MNFILPDAFDHAIEMVRDGFTFERFAQAMLCQIVGQEFVPMGGVKDRGIDGLEHTFVPKGVERTVYQASIEEHPEPKVENSLEKLQKNQIDCQRFFYVTNREVKNQDQLIERYYAKYGIMVAFRDVAWLRGNVNKSEGTVRTYLAYIESHLHEYTKPGKSYEFMDLERDPRVYVFLRQQWETYGDKVKLDELLADSLIIYALEGTDPDKNILRGRDEIMAKITQLVQFEPRILTATIDRRLSALSEKAQKRINHHRKEDKYCLPYQTRLELEQKNLEDDSLHQKFSASAKLKLLARLNSTNTRVQDALSLLNQTFNGIFKQQGLDFAQFVIRAENNEAIERSLVDIVTDVVNRSSVIPKNRPKVTEAIVSTIREIIYRGSNDEIEYLRRLAHSYMMLFLLQCDPGVSTYFAAMANKLQVFVCNSLLVPALSEYPLEASHRRHWNLLANAHQAGVRLIVNRQIVSELAGHIRKSIQAYEEKYKGREEIFRKDESIQYIGEILIRSYFYASARGKATTFESFVENFATPSSRNMEDELISWLKYSFGIEYVDDSVWDIEVSQEDLVALTSELVRHKGSEIQATTDATTILTIYGIREKNNERGEQGIFGYRTWWLSKDTKTQRAVVKCFRNRYQTSCYIRPDFLYNYISLAPSRDDTEKVFNVMFPTLLGVSISHHLPKEVTEYVNQYLLEHADKYANNPGRIPAILKSLTERLKTEANTQNLNVVRHYLDEAFRSS